MSTDARVTKDLIETLEDGKKGFADAAEKLTDTNRTDLAKTFHRLSSQRAEFSRELEKLAATYGDDIDEDGSVLATVHRGWMSLKDAIAGSDPDGILDAAEQGEDHAVSEYRKALEEDVSANLRGVIRTQFDQIQKAHAEVKALRNSVE